MWTVISIVVLCVVLVYINFCAAQIVGESMFPTMKDGEYYLCRRLFNKRKIDFSKYLGRVFVYRPPTADGKTHDYYVVKRLIRVSSKGKLWFEGDNKEEGKSYDSRFYGFVKKPNIIGIIVKKV